MTFQMAFNPPGGVRPIKDDANPSNANNAYANPPDTNNAYAYPPSANNDDQMPPYICKLNRDTDLCPGEAVLA
ncbi:ankyrin repeat plant-like protein, partial [Trifolium medium]|nr:ankyrin repeat plant-like protein [Trifolium medium]